jgi:indolepyruvate ferredoxin oxidoreductase alpha subunit
VLNKLKVPVNGDIGCYTLGLIPPLSAIHTCGCMGAGIGVAHGALKAGSRERHVAVIGDSTFLHSGMTPLLDVVYNSGTITTIILDNSTTAMTGHQEHPGTGRSVRGAPARKVNLETLVRGLGVEDVKVVNAFAVDEVSAAIRDSVERDEPSVVIVKGECSLKAKVAGKSFVVDTALCDGCGACLRTGCPAIVLRDEHAEVQEDICVGIACGVCAQVCPKGAILAPGDGVRGTGGRGSSSVPGPPTPDPSTERSERG